MVNIIAGNNKTCSIGQADAASLTGLMSERCATQTGHM